MLSIYGVGGGVYQNGLHTERKINCESNLYTPVDRAGPSGCGVVTAAELKALDEKKPEQARSAQEILAVMERSRNFNPGGCVCLHEGFKLKQRLYGQGQRS